LTLFHSKQIEFDFESHEVAGHHEAYLSTRRKHLRLVDPVPTRDLPDVLADPRGRREVEALTERLVDILIEMQDLVDGDPEQEPNGDETEDHDGI